jgi:uncharacterized SAM-binding protein YcdF (DUF218 family)
VAPGPVRDLDRLDLERLAVIAEWLALTDAPPTPEEPADLVLLFGASLPDAWDAAASLVLSGAARRLMVVGGHGHTTELWLSLVGGAPGATEASVMAAHLARVHGLAEVLVEDASTNCGDNVHRALAVSREHGLDARSVVLVQDPSMQRRMDAVFRLAWPSAVPVNRPGSLAGAVRWPLHRWRALVTGEVPRLRDDADGYGPRGAGHLAHVDVPAQVEAAYAALLADHPDWGRPADPRWASS